MFPGVVWYSRKLMDFGVFIGTPTSSPSFVYNSRNIAYLP